MTVTILLAFIIAFIVFTFTEIFSHTALTCCLVSFHFTLQDSLEHFVEGRSNGNELPQLLSVNVLISPSFNTLNTTFWPPVFLLRNMIILLRILCILLLSAFCCWFQDCLLKVDYNVSQFGLLEFV